MQRFYFPGLPQNTPSFLLEESEIIHQLTKVLRLEVWDEIMFFDGKNSLDVLYEITQINKKNILVNRKDTIQKRVDEHHFSLFQAIPNKIDKIEDILSKGTQVWYKNFYFFRSERSQNFFISDAKIMRFQNIVKESVEQSGRNDIPNIYFIDDFKNYLQNGENIVFQIGENFQKLSSSLLKKDTHYQIFIGPEGGWSPKEMENFLKNNVSIYSLKWYVLRAETAAVSVGFYFSQI